MSNRSSYTTLPMVITTLVAAVIGGLIGHSLTVDYWIARSESHPNIVLFCTGVVAIIVGAVVGCTYVGLVRSQRNKRSKAQREGATGYFGIHGHRRDRV